MYAIVGLLINLNYISSETRLPPGRLAGQGGLIGIPRAAPRTLWQMVEKARVEDGRIWAGTPSIKGVTCLEGGTSPSWPLPPFWGSASGYKRALLKWWAWEDFQEKRGAMALGHTTDSFKCINKGLKSRGKVWDKKQDLSHCVQVPWDALGKVSGESMVSDKASDIYMNQGSAITDIKACKWHPANLQGFLCKWWEIRPPNWFLEWK